MTTKIGVASIELVRVRYALVLYAYYYDNTFIYVDVDAAEPDGVPAALEALAARIRKDQHLREN